MANGMLPRSAVPMPCSKCAVSGPMQAVILLEDDRVQVLLFHLLPASSSVHVVYCRRRS